MLVCLAFYWCTIVFACFPTMCFPSINAGLPIPTRITGHTRDTPPRCIHRRSTNLTYINPVLPIVGRRYPIVKSQQSVSGVNYANLVPVHRKSADSVIRLSTINARSLRSNYSLIKPLVLENNIALSCITETWLKSDDVFIPREFTPEGFSFFRAS